MGRQALLLEVLASAVTTSDSTRDRCRALCAP
jgi:hypothetical protein